MHTDFPRWYSSLEIGNDQSRRQSRWEAIYKIATEAATEMIEPLLRLAFKTRVAPQASLEAEIRKFFKATDDTFEMQGNDREIQILAAACLAVMMEVNEDLGARAALSVTTAEFGGARKPKLPIDLGNLGEAAIAQWAKSNSDRPNLNKYRSSDAPKFDFEKATAKITETPDFSSVIAAFTLAADATRGALRQLAIRQSNALYAVDRFLKVQDEELQLLWWLTGQRSFDYDCSFDAVPTDAQPLVLAHEVAGMTEFSPGPVSVKAILSRAGLKERKKLAVVTAINAVDGEWLKRTVGETDPSPLATPLHAAAKRQLETGAGDAWVAGWAAAASVDAEHSLTPLSLAMQFYRERLLIRFA
ncbi:GTPase-associated system all-helical protein GASH [Rhizobium sp. M10]|uniref:GTPase-associated system all-helical protein GASH n=1 Tax=Rhizobium sp. M10 TaxID=1324586 RepID=UPI0011441FA1|nr:GTPase-associated system all-helical protein GASH [Rhizobium sp. M10]